MVHWLVLIWAVLVLVSSVGIVVLILTRSPRGDGPSLFAPKAEGAETHAKMGQMIDTALAQTETDAEFEQAMHRLLDADPEFETPTQWASLVMLMNNTRRAGDPLPGTRLLARRLLDSFPRMSGAK